MLGYVFVDDDKDKKDKDEITDIYFGDFKKSDVDESDEGE